MYGLLYVVILSLILFIPTILRPFIDPTIVWQIIITFSIAFLLTNYIYTIILIRTWEKIYGKFKQTDKTEL